MTELVEQLHRAADWIGEGRTAQMDELAAAGARFLRETDLSTLEDREPVTLTVEQAIGYGIMLGWLARDA